jgi:hypothetical protein
VHLITQADVQSVVTCLQPLPIYTQFFPEFLHSPRQMKHICIYQHLIYISIFYPINVQHDIILLSLLCNVQNLHAHFLSRQLIKPRGKQIYYLASFVLPLQCTIQEAQSSTELQIWLQNPLELCTPSKSCQPIKAGWILQAMHDKYLKWLSTKPCNTFSLISFRSYR